ncbi:DUF4391 domain-containing protein [Psychrobacter celer]|uniref:DUF4391 domain-containing protein n=1 Tax=Psychrobacter celer TaxID=306572 RepID=UPI0018DF7CD1|nr:DUF4391 domain-containing protein [Psychrobacter celer]
MILYQYPPSAAVDRPVAKKRLYEQGAANSKLKQKFIDQVAKITWAYKLSAGTLNIQTDTLFQEVQIFRIVARTADIDTKIIKYIDKLIPTPVIFEVIYNDKVQVVATYKRVSQADKSKIVLNKYYSSEWLADDQREPLPFVLNLSDLYTHLIEQLLPSITNDAPLDQLKPPSQAIHPKAIDADTSSNAVSIVAKAELNPTARVSINAGASIEDKLKHVQQVESLTKQISQLQKKVKKEAQFNRKVELNMRLHKLKDELNQLIAE